MASIRKYKKGYRVEVRKDGFYKSKTFTTKRDAITWANEQEILISKHKKLDSKLPFRDAMQKYLEEITPHKKTADKEILRIKKFMEDKISYIAIEDLTPGMFEEWAARRMIKVSSSTVLREWNILSHICHTCVSKWKLMIESPMTHAIRPKEGKARDRLPTEEEIQKLFFVANYVEYEKPVTVAQKVMVCWFFGLETALRSKEIYNLRWDEVTEKTAFIRETKTGHSRTIPLSGKARRIIESMVGIHPEKVFNINASSLDANFRKQVKKAAIENLQFRDSRHYALTKMADKLSPYQLAKVAGHRSLDMILNVYYNPDIGDIANLLD